MPWVLYILQCNDGTLYTGITNNLKKRLAAHNAGTGARYTRGRRPVHAVYRQACADRVTALRKEYALKQRSRREKLALIGGRKKRPKKRV
ncbi:MAG: GIY-YIG nuclease family protein [Chitinivibrionales bacterium]|nr:GIY-YIG nuclease family protein [Chitinivibrionales bacterium]